MILNTLTMDNKQQETNYSNISPFKLLNTLTTDNTKQETNYSNISPFKLDNHTEQSEIFITNEQDIEEYVDKHIKDIENNNSFEEQLREAYNNAPKDGSVVAIDDTALVRLNKKKTAVNPDHENVYSSPFNPESATQPNTITETQPNIMQYIKSVTEAQYKQIDIKSSLFQKK
jgi:hypothetical protein